MPLQLGSIVFDDWELPESMPLGVTHAFNVHRPPGAAKTVDAMGPDDEDISWSGRFRGIVAPERARQVATLVRQGLAVELTWDLYSYLVVVKRFRPEFRQRYEIPYSITVTVLADLAQTAFEALYSDLDMQVGSDLTGCATAIGATAGTLANVALGAIQATVTGAGALRTASTAVLAGISGAANAQAAMLAQQQVVLDASLSGQPIGGIVAGGDPALMAAQVAAQNAAMAEAYATQRVQSTALRVAANIALT